MNIVRTKEEFDQWFEKNNGDPWGYHSKYVIDRLNDSVRFINQYLPGDFKGDIIEFGSFEGSFTTKLLKNFPFSHVIAIDISETASRKNKIRCADYSNVTFECKDMLSFNYSVVPKDRETAILFMESLYYLRNEEREEMIENIKMFLPDNKLIFISTPVIGDRYFTEDSLKEMMIKFGYHSTDHLVLNVRRFFFNMGWTKNVIQFVKPLRAKIANQVIFKFEKL